MRKQQLVLLHERDASASRLYAGNIITRRPMMVHNIFSRSRAMGALLVLFAFFFANSAFSQIPKTISYQGVIAGSSGQPIGNGSHVITVTFYDVPSGGAELYSESHNTRTDAGIFNIQIGSVTPMPSSLTFDKVYYLGFKVDGGDEFTPRTALASAPYALRTPYAELAGGLASDVKGVVTSINEIAGSIRLTGDSTITVDQNGQTISIHAKPATLTQYAGIDSVTSPAKTLAITNQAGKVVKVDVADNAITAIKLADGAVTADKLNSMGATSGQVLKWNGTKWIPTNESAGLATVAVTPRIKGDGSVGNPLDIAQQGASNGQVLSWNGTNWVPANAAGGTVNANAPITGNGSIANPLSIAAANGVTNGFLSSADWTTFNSKLSVVSVTPRLSGTGLPGNPIDIAQQAATNGQVLSWNGSSWVPATVGGLASVTSDAPLSGAGTAANHLKIANGTNANDVLTWNGTNWVPAAPTTGLTSVSVNAPITGNGTIGNPLAIAAANAVTNGYLTSTDWTTFNNKLSSVTADAPLTGQGTAASHLKITDGTTANDVLTWNGTSWISQAPTTGLTSVSVTAPITGNGTSGNPLAMASVNASTNGYLTSTDWTTFNNKLSSVAVTTRLTGNGTSANPLDIAQQGATTGQVLTWSGSFWVPANGGLTSVTADAPLSGLGTAASHLKITDGSANGQILLWNGTAWTIAANPGLTSVSVTAPITGNGTSANPLAMAAANGTTNGYLTSTDWTTFNNKLSSVSVTARLTGNGTSASPLDIAQQAATNGQVLSWNGTSWAPATVGGLTSVTADAPLSGLGTAASHLKITDGTANGQILLWNGTAWTIAANPGLTSVSVTAPITGNGTSASPLAMAAANGTTNGYLTSTDWTTFNNKLSSVAVTARLTGNGTAASPLDIAQQAATNGQVLTWNGTSWAPANGGLTSVTADAPLSGAGTAASHLKITDGTVNGQILLWNGTAWTIAANPGLTSVSVTAPITGNGTVGSPLAMAAANGTTNGYLTSTDWTTFNNKLSSVSVTARLTGNGTSANPLDIAQQGATTGQVLSWNGTNWAPANGGGGLSSVTADAPLSGAGTAASHLKITDGTATGQILIWNGTAWAAAADPGLASVTANAPITGSGTAGSPLNIAQASGANSGYLSSADWTTFNNKLSSVVADAPLSGSGTAASHLKITNGTTTNDVLTWNGTSWVSQAPSGLTAVSVTAPLAGNGTSGNPLAMPPANGSTNGYLSATDWTTFNNKLSTVSVTQRLTGNGTLASPLDLASQSATNGQVLKWNGTSWAPAADGGITSITSDAPLTGAGTAASHLKITDGTVNGQVLTWNGSAWTAATGAATVTTSAPISGNGSAGNPLTIAAANGSTNGYLTSTDWTTFNNKLSTVTVSPRLTGNGTIANPLDLAQQGATNGQVLKWNGTSWSPGNGINSLMLSTRFSGDAVTTNLDLAQQGATTGQVLTWNGAIWAPANGGLTTVSANAPITGNGTPGTPLNIAQATGAVNGYLSSADWTTFNNKLSSVTADAPLSGLGTAASHLKIANGTTNGDVLTWNSGTSTWVASAAASAGWSLSGNALTGSSSSPNEFIGSTNAFDLIFKTGGNAATNERMRITSAGNIGLGRLAPTTIAKISTYADIVSATQSYGHYLQTNFPNTLSAVNTPTFGVWSQYDVFNNATLNSSNQLQGSMVAATSLKGQGVDFARGFIGLTDIETSPASAITHTSVEGITGRVYVGATTSNTTIGSATSLLADLWMLSSNVTVTSAYQLRISNAGLSAGTLTNYYGVYVGALGATSTTISSYNAMYVGDISNGAATKRAFFYDATSGTNKPFAILSSGNTGIGTSTPSQLLEVKDGNILLSRNSVASRQLQFQSSNGTGLSTFEAGGQANTTINYTLPTSAPSANQVLTATGIAGSVVTLSWAAAGAGSGWALTGNSGTTAGTNFVGTTDDQPLYLQVKNTGTATIYNSLQLGNSATSPSALYREKTASTTGNARGANSVDLQISRSAATQVASGSASVISGGTNNTVSGANSVIGGGSGNSISGGYSAIDGGGNLTLGDNSFGFNGTKTVGAPSTANLSGVNGIAYFGDVDLWLGNVNNSARQLRFYKGNSSSTYAGALYSSFEAGATQGATINYILPLSQPAAGNILQASTVSGAGPYTVQLAWTSNNTGWNTSGNTNTDTLATGANNFIGTTDIMPFEVRVNANAGSGGNGRVLRLEPNSVSPNIIAGYNQNTAIGTFTTGGAGRSVYGVGILSGGESGALMNNYVSDNYGVVVGGRANQAGDNAGTVSDKSFAVVGGGEKNTAAGQYSFIAGGSYLKLGDYSFGYNHATGTTQTDISTSSGTAYLGNVNLWIGNTDNSPRQLRFYAGNNANYTYPATVYYTSFAAGAQGANINYILPTAAPVASGNLLYSTTGGAMSWSSGMAWDFTNTRLGVNTASPNTKLDVNGDVAMRESAMTFANNNNNVNIGNVSFVTVTGPTANFTITGFQSGQNGKMLIVCNLTGFSMTVNHLDNNSNVSNRVICENGLNQTVGAVAGFGCMTFIYSTSANAGNGAWLLVSKN